MIRDEGQWRVRWSSNALHPKLGEHQTLSLRADPPRRATVNEVSGTEVLVPGYLYHYQLDASKAGSELMSSARVVADVLHQFDDQLNPQQLAERASSAKGPLDLITLRPSDHDKVALALDALPGVVVIPQPDMLPTEEDFAPAVVSEVKKAVLDELDGEAGWRVFSVNQNGVDVDVLTEAPPKPAPSITLTLDRAVQQAAQDAVDMQGRKAMLVVIKPSNGDILAVAQNRAADADGPAATTGLYPPGSTFKIVTASAAIQRNLADPDTMVGCPGDRHRRSHDPQLRQVRPRHGAHVAGIRQLVQHDFCRTGQPDASECAARRSVAFRPGVGLHDRRPDHTDRGGPAHGQPG